MKRFLCMIVLLAAVLCLAGCAARGPIKKTAETCLSFYSEPKAEEEVLGTPAVWYAGRAIDWGCARMLRRYVNAIASWTDDCAANHKPFEFIGEFYVRNGDIFYFTEDGTLYYDHYFGKLSDEGREFLMSLDPEK